MKILACVSLTPVISEQRIGNWTDAEERCPTACQGHNLSWTSGWGTADSAFDPEQKVSTCKCCE